MISWNDLSEKPANVSYTFSFVTMTNYSGVVTQPITYLEKPLLTADKEVSYPINISKTEEGFLNDVHAKTDSDATITSDYNDVVNLQVAGDYLVTLNAENTAGLKADPVQVTIHVTKQVQAPPIITADKKILYESGAEISEAEFLKAIHAKTNDGSEVTSNFDTKVNLNKPGKYQVSLNAENEAGKASPVNVTVIVADINKLPDLIDNHNNKGNNLQVGQDNNIKKDQYKSSGSSYQINKTLPTTGDTKSQGLPIIIGGIAVIVASLYLLRRK
ncbi:LapB repeat-containing protein [Listeria monocytogenes]|nr:LapB repeat-containing protein [Listeria monocytogenes]EHM3395695.1 LapB repeat-containing protein [Listeria monocytogenes]EKJ1381273.1 LapB repeat-containing protein [Listeria monocytogenes]